MNLQRFNSRPSRLTWLLFACSLTTTLITVAIYLLHPPFVRTINNKTTDLIMASGPLRATSGRVVIVDIDEKSLARYGQWPWPRNRLAQLLQSIAAAAPAGIGLDLILAEPDRTSPDSRQTADSAVRKGTADRAGKGRNVTDHDRILANTLSRGPFILGCEFLFDRAQETPTDCQLHPVNIVSINNGGGTGTFPSVLFRAGGAVCNQRVFADAVTGSGFLNATADSDGLLRRIPQLIMFNDRYYASLALAMLLRSSASNQLGIREDINGLLKLIVGKRQITVDRHGNMLVDFSRTADRIQRVSAGDLIAGTIAPDQFKNRLVLVGSSAAGLNHSYQTAAGPVHADVEVHARLLDNMLAGQSISRSREFLIWEGLAAVIAALLLCLAIARLNILASALVGGGCLCIVWGVAVVLYRANGCLYSPFLPSLLLLLNYPCLTIIKTWENLLTANEIANNTLLLLRSSEKNLNSIIKTVPDIIFRLDAAGRITFISQAISKYVNTPDQLIGQPIFDLVAPDDLAKARYRLNEKRTGTRATYGLEVRLLLPERQEDQEENIRYFSVSAEGIYRNDTPCSSEFIGTQGIIHDITERKKLEERLLHAQKMETLGNLAAGVAHDLNNVLAGLVTYPDLLMLELHEDSPMRSKISIIQRSGQKAAAIVHDLLTLARRGVKNSGIINVNSIITDYLASPESAATSRLHPNIRIETALAADLMNAKGDRVHLSKVVMNLLNNSAEAMPTGGTIRITSGNRFLDTQLHAYEEIPPGEYVMFTVADEGVGIASDDMARIFEPFFSKKAMNRSGSGLGMTVIWATVKDHSGYVDLQSREGEGTTITVYLPVTREQEMNAARRIGLEEYLGTEKVLIVDDLPEQLQIAANMLTKLGYAVASVSSGKAAVEYLQNNTVDLLVLDMIMPGGMDGLETYQRILEILPKQKAIITSGYSESERVTALQKLGAGAYIQKPYTLERLGIAVRKELDR